MHSPYAPTPRAVIATGDAAVRALLSVLLEDRGFSIEQAHRAEYLATVAPDADLLVADVGMFLALLGEPATTSPHETIILSRVPTPSEEQVVRGRGASHYYAVPFQDPPTLASNLDSIAARAFQRAASLEPSFAGVR